MKKPTAKSKYLLLEEYSKLLIRAIHELDQPALNKTIDLIWSAYKSGKTIFFAGNGGSASTASHIACDLGKNTTGNHSDNRENRLKTISLCDNMAWITAVGNDISFDEIFVEQLKNQGSEGDLLIIFTGSGKSLNVIKAALWAKENKLRTIGILGFDGGSIKDFLDLSLIVKSSDYGIVESMHSYIHHYIVEVIKQMKGAKDS